MITNFKQFIDSINESNLIDESLSNEFPDELLISIWNNANKDESLSDDDIIDNIHSVTGISKNKLSSFFKTHKSKLDENISYDLNEETYAEFFLKKLKEYNVKSPSELSEEDKKNFFNEIKKDWK